VGGVRVLEAIRLLCLELRVGSQAGRQSDAFGRVSERTPEHSKGRLSGFELRINFAQLIRWL